MNDGKEPQNEKLETFLRKARLPEPSPELKDRITAEATRVWNQTLVELSWRIPLMRLAASVAAALLVIWLANFSSDYFLARWQSDETSVTRQPSSEFDVLPEMPYGPYVKHLTSITINRGLPVTGGSGLRDYVETVRKLLDEVQQNNISTPTAPIGDRSRLYPDRTNRSSYS